MVPDNATSRLWSQEFRCTNSFYLTVGTAENHRDDSGYDYPLEWEAFYEVEINDSITITPAVFNIKKNGAEDVSGALGKATFKF